MSETKRKACIGIDGKLWCLPCEFTNNPPRGGSRFGWRDHPCGKGYKHHNGLDLSGYQGMPLYATKDGVIEVATYDSDCGNYIILNHGDGTKSVYLHMGKAYGDYPHKEQVLEKNNYTWLVKQWDEIKQGRQIGTMGSTGCSTGPHLHFGVQKTGVNSPVSRNYVDPMLYIGGPIIEIDVENPSIEIADDLKVNNVELSVDDNWSPIDCNISNLTGTRSSLLMRRRSIMNNRYKTIFNRNKNDYNIIGINPLLKSGEDFKFDSNDNSYWNVALSKCGFKEKNNLSYCISRVNSLLEDKEFIIPSNMEDWYTYMLDNELFETGSLPRLGSIMCWKNNNSYEYYIIEEVISTHCLKISEYKNNNVVYRDIKNMQGNWGMSSNYKLQGYIHVLPTSLQIKDESASVQLNNKGELELSLNNDTNIDKYLTAMFVIPNMKHVNNIKIKTEMYENNTDSNNNNYLYVNLSQQVWNCTSIGTLSSKEDEDTTLRILWPFTYFPENMSELRRYNAPYPTGTLTIDKININKKSDSPIKLDQSYNIYDYQLEDKSTPTFTTLQYGGLLRNYPGYLCLTIKAPAIKNKNKKTSTKLVVKEISVCG